MTILPTLISALTGGFGGAITAGKLTSQREERASQSLFESSARLHIDDYFDCRIATHYSMVYGEWWPDRLTPTLLATDETNRAIAQHVSVPLRRRVFGSARRFRILRLERDGSVQSRLELNDRQYKEAVATHIDLYNASRDLGQAIGSEYSELELPPNLRSDIQRECIEVADGRGTFDRDGVFMAFPLQARLESSAAARFGPQSNNQELL